MTGIVGQSRSAIFKFCRRLVVSVEIACQRWKGQRRFYRFIDFARCILKLFGIRIKYSGDKSFEEYCRERIVEICFQKRINKFYVYFYVSKILKKSRWTINSWKKKKRKKEKKRKRECAKKKRSLMKRIIIFNCPESLTNSKKLLREKRLIDHPQRWTLFAKRKIDYNLDTRTTFIPFFLILIRKILRSEEYWSIQTWENPFQYFF